MTAISLRSASRAFSIRCSSRVAGFTFRISEGGTRLRRNGARDNDSAEPGDCGDAKKSYSQFVSLTDNFFFLPILFRGAGSRT